MKIFISYRRADSQSNTDRIHEHLAEVFGAENVFQDVLDIDYGFDFREVLRKQVSTCDVVLVIIGPIWATIVDQDERAGTPQPRLFNPDDFVRFEVETGLNSQDTLVIPVLVNEASLPEEAQLPPSLHLLCYRNAITVRNNPYFADDMARLIRQLQEHARKEGIPLRRVRAIPRHWKLMATAVLLVLVVGISLLLTDSFGANEDNGPPPSPTFIDPSEFQVFYELPFEHIEADFEAIDSETLPDAALKDFLTVDRVFWGHLLDDVTYGYDVSLTLNNTGTRAIKLALDPRYFSLEDQQGQQAELLYFCCATQDAILSPGQQRQVHLIFKERENWTGVLDKLEGRGVEITFFFRVTGFLPIVRDSWVVFGLVTAN